MSDEEEPGLGLDEVLAALRHDLVAARDDAGGDGYGLGVSEVEVELSVEVSRSTRGEGSVGAKWFVLSGDVSGEYQRDRSRAHRIRLTLKPADRPTGSEAVAGPHVGSDGSSSSGGAGGGDGVAASASAESIGPPIADTAEPERRAQPPRRNERPEG